MEHSYLVRYGLTRQVGRFSASARFERGRTVVIRSHRGTELGELLAEISPPSSDPAATLPNPARVLRAAEPDDLRRARQVTLERSDRFARCRQVFEDGIWPLELIDVEPLLDDRRTVLHYLGPHRLDASGLLDALRMSCDLDVVLEPVGRDVSEADVVTPEPEAGCGDCGGGSCGSGGGCGTDSHSSSAGCSSCGVKNLLKGRRLSPAH